MCRLGLLRLSESNFEPHRGFRPVPPHAPFQILFLARRLCRRPKNKKHRGGRRGKNIKKKSLSYPQDMHTARKKSSCKKFCDVVNFLSHRQACLWRGKKTLRLTKCRVFFYAVYVCLGTPLPHTRKKHLSLGAFFNDEILCKNHKSRLHLPTCDFGKSEFHVVVEEVSPEQYPVLCRKSTQVPE